MTFPAMLARRLWGRTADQARRASRCIRCWRLVDPAALPDIDRREYAISALCPECFAAIFPEEDA